MEVEKDKRYLVHNMSLLKDTFKCFKERGFFDTSLIIYSALLDSFTDFQKGIASSGTVSIDHKDSRNYRPTRAIPFEKLMRSFDFNKSGNFVDFGCGKGRVLLLAEDYSFANLVGIELDSELCQQSKNNLKDFSNIEINNCNATDYSIKNEDVFFYFYDPFTGEVLRKVLENIINSSKLTPRPITIVYHHNFEKAPDDQLKLGSFEMVAEPEFLGNKFYIYQNN